MTSPLRDDRLAGIRTSPDGERGILKRWAEKHVGGHADYPTADKLAHALTILRYDAMIDDLLAEVDRLREENENAGRGMLLLAKLAADSPQFDNPLHAWGAKQLRDDVLARAAKETSRES